MALQQKQIKPSWQPYANEWLGTFRAAGLSENTYRTRKRQLRVISDLLESGPLTATGKDLVSIFAAKAWRPETRKGYYMAVRMFFRWLRANNYRNDDPSALLPRVKKPRPKPRPCPDDVLRRAMRKATDSEKLMLRLGAECGLRRSEIAAVSTRDIVATSDGYSLIVDGKGDKERTVPIADDLARQIRATGTPYLFPGRWSGHVESSYIAKHVKKLLEGYTAHSLRHRYATQMYAQTHDILMVSKLLGHESVETTQRYVAYVPDNARKALGAIELSA